MNAPHPIELAERYLRVRTANESFLRDPLSSWRFAVPRLKQGFALFTGDDPIDELHMRGPNKGSKTESLAAFVLACLQKREQLDGVVVPQWRGKIEGAQLVLDFKQQVLSVQPAYLRLLGKWPHHARYTGEILSSLMVLPLGGDLSDETTWSVLHFLSQENKRSGVGVRADVVAFDEPPVMPILRELRKAAHAGRRCVTVIADTPTVRRQWTDLKDDYGNTPRRSIRRVDQERAEVRWSLDEVADWVLSKEEKTKMRRRYASDPLKDAREHGDYISTEGACPFDVAEILRMMDECREPELLECRIPLEDVVNNKTATLTRVTVEVFGKVKRGSEYYICIDPASGTDDGRHNPAGMHIVEKGSGDLVERWNGYLAPYSLGVLAASRARQWNGAEIDIEMKDHWGVNVVRGVTGKDAGYHRLCSERRELKPNVWAKEVGFDNNEETRSVIIGCVQEWIEAWRSGVKYAFCPSRKVFECLLDCELDDRSKIVAGAGAAHGEDLILRGQSLRRAVTRSYRAAPEPYVKPRTEAERLGAIIRGERTEADLREAQPIMAARRGPLV